MRRGGGALVARLSAFVIIHVIKTESERFGFGRNPHVQVGL
jgi:hypothetical protein